VDLPGIRIKKEINIINMGYLEVYPIVLLFKSIAKGTIKQMNI
jgi:hypothetical protein